jgi:hypothetical protein
VAKLSWAERLIETPYWKGCGFGEEYCHSTLLQLEVQLQAREESKPWRSVKERIGKRHTEGHKTFRRVRKLKNRDLYEENNDDSWLIQSEVDSMGPGEAGTG